MLLLLFVPLRGETKRESKITEMVAVRFQTWEKTSFGVEEEEEKKQATTTTKLKQEKNKIDWKQLLILVYQLTFAGSALYIHILTALRQHNVSRCHLPSSATNMHTSGLLRACAHATG